ncbi:MAG: hypothetical protein IPK59_02035 [Rhodospirillaceae bacterium]|nr:hypothetical protein [Rhodospirillaceae bacterium]
MFRIMSIATLVMIAICFFVGAGLAFADEGHVEPLRGIVEQINDASRPVDTLFEENLAQNDRDGDAYDFSDYFQQPATTSATPPVDAEEIEEPELNRNKTLDC